MDKRWIRHGLFWTGYLLFETYVEFAWVSQEFPALSAWKRLGIAFISEAAQMSAIKIPLIYTLFFLQVAYHTEQANRRFLAAAGLLVGVAALLLDRVLIVCVLLPYVYGHEEYVSLFEIQRLISNMLDLVFIAGIAVAAKQYSISQRMRERERSLIREKLETELNFLKSQINPHFLFNTLNNIYSLARKKSDETADVVVKLSKLLRFVLYESQKGEITVGRELQFLKDYIELEKIRYDERLDLRFTHRIESPNKQLAPLLLVPLVENAFKHGASEATEKAFVHIALQQSGMQLNFDVVNSVDSIATGHSQEGIGLNNLRRRLELTYPGFNLQTHRRENRFYAHLTLSLPP